MSADRQSTLARRLAGKWQIPLLLLAVALFFVTLFWLRPRPPAPAVDRVVRHLQTMAAGLMLPEAGNLARDILADSRYTPAQLAPVHAMLAEVLFRQEARRTAHEDRDLVGVLATYAQAEVRGYSFTADDHVRQGMVNEWLNRGRAAADHYHQALAGAPEDALDVRRRLLSLHLEQIPADQEWLDTQLEQLIHDAAGRPEILAWALEQRLERLVDQGRPEEAWTLLEQGRAALAGSALDLQADYLSALLYYRCARRDEAELQLRSLCARLPERDDLHARASWLLGRLVLQDDGPGRPLQALGLFEEVLTSHPDSPYAAAARLGKAEALTQLQRHDEALDSYRLLIVDLQDGRAARLVERAAVQAALAVLSQQLLDRGQPDHALAYLQTAADMLDLTDPGRGVLYLRDLAAVKDSAASQARRQAAAAGTPEDRRAGEQRSQELVLSAAADYLTLARLETHDEDARAQYLWQAAVLFDAGGQRTRTIVLLEDFVSQCPASPDVPRALHRLGQVYQAEGDLDRAIERYQACIRDFTRTGPAQDSIIPLADCFIMQGPIGRALAEQTLLSVVEESALQPAMFTPQSLIYRDALFCLGELYARTARTGDAIVRLDEALQRYPDDQRRPEATFLLADAYRQSALALDEVGAGSGSSLRRQQLQQLKRERLFEARRRFNQVIELLSVRPPDALTSTQRLQLLLSALYRADCTFDAGDYEAALQHYQEAIRAHPGHPLGLAACVQVVSCLEMLGRKQDIAATLRRAAVLAERIEPQHFEDGLTSRDAAGWQKLFAWLEKTAGY